MGIGILRDKQQIGVLRMLAVEGQDVIKTLENVMFVYLLCTEIC
jgi:hypothetical protein